MTSPPEPNDVLAAIAAYAGKAVDEITEAAGSPRDGTIADPVDVAAAIEDVKRRVELAPIDFDEKRRVVAGLRILVDTPPTATRAEVIAWGRLIRDLPPAIVEIDRAPIELPAMPFAQEEAWQVLLDLDEEMTGHWCLIGGQMITLLCVEYGVTVPRPTEDADIVLGVWIDREALKAASGLLRERDFEEDQTNDGYGYRYRRGRAMIDLLLPENISDQDTVPTTTSGRRGFEVPGGNQALIRAERVPVRLGSRLGSVRRPSVLGALVAKSAAARADNRDPDRHRDDIAVLGQIALDHGLFRAMARMANPKDRKRLRYAIESMPAEHRSWRLISEPEQVRSALERLAV